MTPGPESSRLRARKFLWVKALVFPCPLEPPLNKGNPKNQFHHLYSGPKMLLCPIFLGSEDTLEGSASQSTFSFEKDSAYNVR